MVYSSRGRRHIPSLARDLTLTQHGMLHRPTSPPPPQFAKAVAAAEAGYAPLRAASPELARRLVGLIPQARLNTSLYEDQVRVSFLLNYFKRPWAIDGMVAAYLKCRAVLPSEMVVNVDNPEEAAEWVKHVYPTQGFVVPVFSYNLHEARGYNRAARTAKGDIVVILQVRGLWRLWRGRLCCKWCTRCRP